MAGWYHQTNGHELGQTPGDHEEQESLANCSPRGRKWSDMTWRMNNNKRLYFVTLFNLYAEYIILFMLGEISTISDMQTIPP